MQWNLDLGKCTDQWNDRAFPKAAPPWMPSESAASTREPIRLNGCLTGMCCLTLFAVSWQMKASEASVSSCSMRGYRWLVLCVAPFFFAHSTVSQLEAVNTTLSTLKT